MNLRGRTGPMIMGDSLGFTVGGGLCQITTTLFNAALLANLQILEKHNHNMDIWGNNRFIELGRMLFAYTDGKI